MNNARPLRLLTVAGSDPTGGAGIQADLQVFHSFAAYGLSVPTSLTAQNTTGVQSVWPIDAHFIHTQLETLLSDIAIDGVKIGMLGDEKIVASVFTTLAHYDIPRIVLDPVLVSSSGYPLLSQQGIEQLLVHVPRCTVITPNSLELSRLSAESNTAKGKLTEEEQAHEIATSTGTTVVVTGGHSQQHHVRIVTEMGDCTSAPFIYHDTPHTHGTGCVFSSALLGYMACGQDVVAACRSAIQYVDTAILATQAAPLKHTGHSPLRIPTAAPLITP